LTDCGANLDESTDVVESAKAALKGGFVNFSRGFVRVFGDAKINPLLSFTIAAYNLDRVASSLRKRVPAGKKPTARKRRLGTWPALLERHALNPRLQSHLTSSTPL
jgi:hypothetical protein